MNTITPLTGIPAVGSSTSKSGGQGKQSPPQQGQSLKATVLEAKSSDTFVLEIGGRRISAQARVPLSIGQSLHLQVVSTSPQIELRIMSDSANLFLGKSITLIGKNIDLSSLFTSLGNTPPSTLTNLTTSSQQTLETYSNFTQTALTGKDAGGQLKQLVDRLGLSFEALLARGDQNSAKATLKSALFELSQTFKGANELASSTNKLISTIELYQLAQLQLDQEDLFIFPLPIPFLEKGYLIIDGFKNHQEKSGNDEELHFSLHLALAELGNLRVDFLQNPQGLYIRFFSDSQERLDFIELHVNDLLENLNKSEILGISFTKENVDAASDLLKRLIPDGESLVNTKV